MKKYCAIIVVALLVMAGGAQAQNKKKGSQKKAAPTTEQKGAAEEAAAETPGMETPFVGTVIYNAMELASEEMHAEEYSKMYSDSYHQNGVLTALKGEELRTIYGNDFGYFEFKNLRVFYNIKENKIVVAYQPDTAKNSYYSHLSAEELFGPDNMMFRDLVVMRWNGPHDDADNKRGEYYTNSMQEAKIQGVVANRFSYNTPSQNGVLWAIPSMRVDTWCLPWFGMDYVVADGLTSMPFCPKGLRYHLQISKISDYSVGENELLMKLTDGKEIEWDRLRFMIEGAFAGKR